MGKRAYITLNWNGSTWVKSHTFSLAHIIQTYEMLYMSQKTQMISFSAYSRQEHCRTHPIDHGWHFCFLIHIDVVKLVILAWCNTARWVVLQTTNFNYIAFAHTLKSSLHDYTWFEFQTVYTYSTCIVQKIIFEGLNFWGSRLSIFHRLYFCVTDDLHLTNTSTPTISQLKFCTFSFLWKLPTIPYLLIWDRNYHLLNIYSQYRGQKEGGYKQQQEDEGGTYDEENRQVVNFVWPCRMLQCDSLEYSMGLRSANT